MTDPNNLEGTRTPEELAENFRELGRIAPTTAEKFSLMFGHLRPAETLIDQGLQDNHPPIMKKVLRKSSDAVGLRRQPTPTMTNDELLAAYTTALNNGDITESLRLANLVDFVAAAPAIAPRIIDTTAADNAAKRSGFDYERAILIRDERLLHSI